MVKKVEFYHSSPKRKRVDENVYKITFEISRQRLRAKRRQHSEQTSSDWIGSRSKRDCKRSDAIGSNTKDLSLLPSSARSARNSALGQPLPGSVPEIEPSFELAYFGQFFPEREQKIEGKERPSIAAMEDFWQPKRVSDKFEIFNNLIK